MVALLSSLFALSVIALARVSESFLLGDVQQSRQLWGRIRSTAAKDLRLGLTSEEILAKARQRAGIPEDVDDPAVRMRELFGNNESLLNDMQQALLAMEKRVKEGPGALTLEDVDDLEQQLSRILYEMRENQHKRPARNPSPPSETKLDPSLARSPHSMSVPVPSPLSRLSEPSDEPDYQITDTSQDEGGPAFEGKGGMGQPRGTINTYFLEGMDEMSTEEYRQALDRSISDRQRQRRAAGHVGNRGSFNYLQSLGATKGMFKAEQSSE